MEVDPPTLVRLGTWGQLGALVLAAGCWSLGISGGVLAACLTYLVVTFAGIFGISRTEAAIPGALVYPFLVPGFLPLYYFATR